MRRSVLDRPVPIRGIGTVPSSFPEPIGAADRPAAPALAGRPRTDQPLREDRAVSTDATTTFDIEMTAPLEADRNSGWACVVVADSAARFGTGRAVKVVGTVDDHPIEATMLPIGDGAHMLPVKAAVRSAIGKQVGDEVTIRVRRRGE